MHPVEIKQALDSMVILCDTREQETPALLRRMRDTGRPWERACLTSGDYSARFLLPDGKIFSMADTVAIERKMSVDEICGNFTRGRDRFKREFERMKEKGGKLYILVEGASWENISAGKYRSRLSPASLTASICAWSARYGTQFIFCKPETTGQMIERILYYEAKERLEKME